MRKKTKKAEPCDSKVDFMLGMSPTPGKRATLVIPNGTVIRKQLTEPCAKQGGLYAWNESNTRKTSVLVIPKFTLDLENNFVRTLR
jgi:hypothetical protein